MSLASPEIMRNNCFDYIRGEAQKAKMNNNLSDMCMQYLQEIEALSRQGSKSKNREEQIQLFSTIADKAGWFVYDHRIPSETEAAFKHINVLAVQGIHAERELEKANKALEEDRSTPQRRQRR